MEIPKEIAKKLKNLFLAIFQAKTGWDRPGKGEKYILGPNTADTRTRQENSKKNSKKIQKI